METPPPSETTEDERRQEELVVLLLVAVGIALAVQSKPERDDLFFETLTVAFDLMFEDLGGNIDRMVPGRDAFLSDMRQPVLDIEPDGTDAQTQRLAEWFATATIGSATLAASEEDAMKTWVTRRDDAVRPAHRALEGETIPLLDAFYVGPEETPTRYPGEPVGPIENWIGCRCILRVNREVIEMPEAMAASGGGFSGVVLVALPEGDNTVTYEDGDTTELHQTIAYLGKTDQLLDGEREAVLDLAAAMAESMTPFTARVAGMGTLGADQDSVAITEAVELQALHDMARAHEVVGGMYAERNGHPTWISHITGEGMSAGDEVRFDRIGAWFGGDEHVTFEMASEQEDPVVAAADVMEDQIEEVIEEDEGDPPVPAELIIPEDVNMPVHGVAVVEGVESGDGRKFLEGALTHRDLPLQLTWQRASAAEHDGEVVVGRLDALEKRDNRWHYAAELFGDVTETEEVISLIAQRGLRGVSIAADSGVTEMPTEEEMEMAAATGVMPTTVWSQARISGLTIVQIPAFQEGFIALGPEGGTAATDDDMTGTDPDMERTDDDMEPEMAGGVETFKRGPGWVTNPEETERIHRYWTKGKGAAKIRWGTSGDFTRAVRYLRKYIEPQYLNRTAAQWHHDALGYWPGTEGMPGNPPKGTAKRRAAAKRAVTSIESEDNMTAATTPATSPSITLVAAAPPPEMPMAWLNDPKFTQATPFTVLASGQVFGHIAKWGTCHIGMSGECVQPPHSPSKYAYYHLGEVETDEGRVACGSLTLGTGHADLSLSFAGTKAHYDHTGTVVAKVRAGEDEHGIWVAGGLCEGVSDEQRRTLMASGGISGDWRKIGGHLELVAGLAVNVPGFPVPRVGLAASAAEGQMALVAAGVVVGHGDLDIITDAVIAKMDAREARAARLANVRAFQRTERLAMIAAAAIPDAPDETE